MNKINLVKTLIMVEIKSQRPLVHNACVNELEAFKSYLQQKKDLLSQYPECQLESMVKSLELKKAA